MLLLAGCAPGRGHEAMLVLSDLAAREQPSRLKQLTPAPQRQGVAFSVEGRPYRADLYRPGATARSALLLIHDYDDSIIPFTQSLALTAAVPEAQRGGSFWSTDWPMSTSSPACAAASVSGGPSGPCWLKGTAHPDRDLARQGAEPARKPGREIR